MPSVIRPRVWCSKNKARTWQPERIECPARPTSVQSESSSTRARARRSATSTLACTVESPSGTRASKISSGKSNQDRDELVEFLDRLSVRNAQAALQLLEQRFHQEALDLERCNSLLFRYFERLIAQKPSAALGYDEYIPRMLGENDLRTEWIRKIARGLIKEDPSYLNTLAPHHLAKLEPEDWLPVFQVQQWPEETAEALLHIPTARNQPATRRFIFENGPKTTVLEWLEHGPIRPEERRVAALSILREAPEEADAVFLRWPKLKDASVI